MARLEAFRCGTGRHLANQLLVAVPIGILRSNAQLVCVPDSKAAHDHVKALDDLPAADDKLKRRSPLVARAVKDSAIIEGACIVQSHGVALGGDGASTGLDAAGGAGCQEARPARGASRVGSF